MALIALPRPTVSELLDMAAAAERHGFIREAHVYLQRALDSEEAR